MKKATTTIKQNSLILISNLIADALICNEFEQLDRQTKNDLALYQTLQTNFFDGDDESIQLDDFAINVSHIPNASYRLMNILNWLKCGVIQPLGKEHLISEMLEFQAGIYQVTIFITVTGYAQLQVTEYELRQVLHSELMGG